MKAAMMSGASKALTAAWCHLLQDSHRDETCHGFVRLDETPADRLVVLLTEITGGANEEPEEKVRQVPPSSH